MRNRTPTKVLPNGAIRYAVYDENSNLLRYEYMLPADEPTDPGTPLTVENILKDTTAAKYGKDSNAVPDEIFALLGDFLNLSAAKIAIGSYVGTGTYGEAAPNRLTFDFAPDIVLISNAYGYSDGVSSNASHYYSPCIAIRGQTSGFSQFFPTNGSSVRTYFTWGNNFFEWDNEHSAYEQMNGANNTYFYVAVGGMS